MRRARPRRCIIQSPFQNARALAIVEQPSGVYDYQFVDIANGFGRYALTLRKEQTPKLAVHFLIMRGRLKDSAPQPTASFDQGKPVTIAATKWIEVTPVKNIVTVKLEHPAQGAARAGDRGHAAAFRRRRQAARRRSDLLDGRSGGAVARQGAPARSACRISSSSAKRKWRRATRATWLSASFRSRRFAGGDGARWRNGAPRTIFPCARISRPCRSICRA